MAVRLRPLGIALAMLFVAGCAAPHRLTPPAGTPLAGRPRIAVLPLENLAGDVGASEAVTRVLATRLANLEVGEVVDIGQVEHAVRRVRVRNTASLSSEQVRALGDSLGVRFLLTGTVLERGTVTTPEGPVPAVALTLKLLEVPDGRIVWTRMSSRTGQDRETVFGYGRIVEASRLDELVVTEMLKDLERLAGARVQQAGDSK